MSSIENRATRSPEHSGKPALWLLCIAFAVVLVVLLWSAGKNNVQAEQRAPEPAVVELARVQIQENFEMPMRLRGIVESAQQAELGFDISGQLLRVYKEEGDMAMAGEVIAELDTQRLEARRSELQASLERVNADTKLAQLTFERTEKLVAQKLESPQQLDQATMRLEVARAQRKEVQSALNSVDVEWQKSRLTAPFSGMITVRHRDEGTVLTPATPVYTMTNTERLDVRFALPQTDVSLFQIGQKVQVMVNQITMTATVMQQNARRDPRTRTVDMLVQIDSTDKVMPGDVAMLVVNHTIARRGAWVPVSALSSGLRGLWTIFVLDETKPEPSLTSRSVEVIFTDGERAFVRGAIQQGEYFVTSGTHRLSPGQRISKPAENS